jgi:hypothetical protein
MRAVLFTVLVGCSGGSSAVPLFSADYASSFVEVRPCRGSTDHDLNHVRVLADPVGLDAYAMRTVPFPTGSVILKEEYDPADATCQGPVMSWTVMVKLALDSSPTTLDWHWQRVDMGRNVVTDNDPRCSACHKRCGVPPDGYAGTCEVP